MPQKTLYVNISDFGSIAEVNPYQPREATLIRCWCKKNVNEARLLFKETGYIVETDEEVPVAKNIGRVEEDFKKELDLKRPSNAVEANIIKEKYCKKIEEAAVKDKIDKKSVEILHKNILSDVNKKCGQNTEKEILDKSEQKSGVGIKYRNDRMWYKTIYEDADYKFLIGGKVDGISEHNLITEAKWRKCENNVRKNLYDVYQIMGYLFVTGKTKGKIIQKFGKNIWDSDIETENEWGIITLNSSWEEFLNLSLFTFFEELKQPPKDLTVLNKPFLIISNRKVYPSTDNGELEQFLIKTLYPSNLYQPLAKRYISSKLSTKNGNSDVPSSSGASQYVNECFTKVIEKSSIMNREKDEIDFLKSQTSEKNQGLGTGEASKNSEISLIPGDDSFAEIVQTSLPYALGGMTYEKVISESNIGSDENIL